MAWPAGPGLGCSSAQRGWTGPCAHDLQAAGDTSAQEPSIAPSLSRIHEADRATKHRSLCLLDLQGRARTVCRTGPVCAATTRGADRGWPILLHWFSVQNVLTLAANASKLLWGNWAEEARKRLQDAAGVDGSSKLAIRDIRNSLEHFDEKVIKWAQKGTFFIQRDVGPEEEASLAGDEFGRFDPETWEVMFLHEKSVNLKEILDEMDAIASRLSPFH